MSGIIDGVRFAGDSLPERVARTAFDGYAAVAGRTVDFQHQPLGARIDAGGLGGYYCDLRHKARSSIDGMPHDHHGRRDDWVIPVAQAALGFWELLLEGDDGAEAPFLGLADWLLERAEPAHGGVAWRIAFPVPKYGLAAGWTSAMAQGEAASVLLRAHLRSGRDEYVDAARAALAPLLVPVSAGGLSAEVDGALVLEEYPSARPSAVLNGWIFALFGVHELAVAAGSDDARALRDRSLDGLLALLPRYDAGWWTLYSLQEDFGRPDLAKPFYQRLHPVLLDGVSLIRDDPRLAAYAARWRAQLTWPALARATADKLAFGVRRRIRPPARAG